MRNLYAAAAIVLALGCGSAPMPVVTGAPGYRDMLFDAEIQSNKIPGMTVYDLVAQLRPEYLRSRGANSLRNLTPPTAVVYIDGSKYGSLDQMKASALTMSRRSSIYRQPTQLHVLGWITLAAQY